MQNVSNRPWNNNGHPVSWQQTMHWGLMNPIQNCTSIHCTALLQYCILPTVWTSLCFELLKYAAAVSVIGLLIPRARINIETHSVYWILNVVLTFLFNDLIHQHQHLMPWSVEENQKEVASRHFDKKNQQLNGVHLCGTSCC